MVLFTEEEIKAMVERLADAIARDYEGEELVLVILLKGGAWFGIDLSRALERRSSRGKVYIEFMRVSSYGDQRESSGDVKIEMDVQRSIRGRHVLVIDDVADTRFTLVKVREHLLIKEPRSLRVCLAFDKTRKCQRPDVSLDYVGFTNVEGFLVGYGLDDQGACRGYLSLESRQG